MIVLDTNVISEIFRPSPEARVVDWLASLTGDVAITSVTLAELFAGVRRLPDGRRKAELTRHIGSAIEPYRGSRSLLPFDEAAAECYAGVLVAREAAGAPTSTADAQIAAICLAHDASCATRNVEDFEHTGVSLVDPRGSSLTPSRSIDVDLPAKRDGGRPMMAVRGGTRSSFASPCRTAAGQAF